MSKVKGSAGLAPSVASVLGVQQPELSVSSQGLPLPVSILITSLIRVPIGLGYGPSQGPRFN